MRRLAPLGALLALAATGCASPGDVQQRYESSIASAQRTLDTAQADLTRDLATANEWNRHVLGIPASGWTVILVVASVLLFGLLCYVSYQVVEARAERRQAELRRLAQQAEADQALAQKRELTVQQALAKHGDTCWACGATAKQQLDRARATVQTDLGH